MLVSGWSRGGVKTKTRRNRPLLSCSSYCRVWTDWCHPLSVSLGSPVQAEDEQEGGGSVTSSQSYCCGRLCTSKVGTKSASISVTGGVALTASQLHWNVFRLDQKSMWHILAALNVVRSHLTLLKLGTGGWRKTLLEKVWFLTFF